MTREEIIARLPGAGDYIVEGASNAKFKFFGLPKYDVSGCPARVNLTFQNGRLNGIWLSFDIPDKTFDYCVEFLIYGLNSKYGKPVTFDEHKINKAAGSLSKKVSG